MAFRRAAALGLLLPLAAFAGPAHAQGGEGGGGNAASTLDVEYNIYVGGITLGQLTMSLRMEGESYKAISTLRTSGVVDALWSAKIEASSSGTIEGGNLKPTLYYASSQHSDANQQVTVKFPASGAPSYFAEPAYSNPARLAQPADQVNTLDPVSAMVSIATAFRSQGAKPCGTTLPIYDARRRYEVALSFERNANVDMDNGLYAGPVDICRLVHKPISGAPQKISRDGKLPLLRAWMISVQSSADPSRRFVVPLRIWTQAGDIGIAAAVLSSVRLDGAKLAKLNK